VELRPSRLRCAVRISVDLVIASGLCGLGIWLLGEPATRAFAVLVLAFAAAYFGVVLLVLRLLLLPWTLRASEAGVEVRLPGRQGLIPWDRITGFGDARTRGTMFPGLSIGHTPGAPPLLRGLLRSVNDGCVTVPGEAMKEDARLLSIVLGRVRREPELRPRLADPQWCREQLKAAHAWNWSGGGGEFGGTSATP